MGQRLKRVVLVATVATVASVVAVLVSVVAIGIGHPSGLLWIGKLALPYMAIFLKAVQNSRDPVVVLVTLYLALPILQAVAYTYFLVNGPRRARLAVGIVHLVAVGVSFIVWPGGTHQ